MYKVRMEWRSVCRRYVLVLFLPCKKTGEGGPTMLKDQDIVKKIGEVELLLNELKWEIVKRQFDE